MSDVKGAASASPSPKMVERLILNHWELWDGDPYDGGTLIATFDGAENGAARDAFDAMKKRVGIGLLTLRRRLEYVWIEDDSRG